MQPLRTLRLAGGGSIVDVEGDLMQATDSIAHCVSACLGMGKGIALHFRNKFGNVDALRAQKIGVGGVALLPRPDENRFIYYMITKPRYNDKPTYDTLRASMKQMVAHMQKNAVPSVSIPELGCGLDKLEWDKVHAMLCQEFSNTGINITVYHYAGKGQTAPPSTVHRQGGAGSTSSAGAAPAAAAAAATASSPSNRGNTNNNNNNNNNASKAQRNQRQHQQEQEKMATGAAQQAQQEQKSKQKLPDDSKFPALVID